MRQIDLGAFGVSYRYIEGTLVDFSRLFPLHRPYTPSLTYPLLAVHYLHILIAVDVLLDILLTASCVQQPPSCIILPIWVFHCGFTACEAKLSVATSYGFPRYKSLFPFRLQWLKDVDSETCSGE